MTNIQNLHCDFPEFKDLVDAYIPSCVAIPLQDIDGTVCASKVALNARVEEGEIIARNSASSTAIHSTVPGIVTGLHSVPLPNGKKTEAVIIKTDGSFSYFGKKAPKTQWKELTPQDILSLIAEKGVINTFGQACSLSGQLGSYLEQKAEGKKTTLAVRLFDEDPTVRSGSFLASRKSAEIIEGSMIAAHVLSAENIVFICQKRDRKFPAVLREYQDARASKATQDRVPDNGPKCFSYKADTDHYPSGGLKDIHRLLSKNRFSHDDIIAIDAQTAYGTYTAVALDEPLLERYVQFSGSPLATNKLFRVRIGTSLRKLVEECGGFRQSVYKIVANGLIKGIAISDLDTPVTADLNSVTFLPKAIIPFQKQVHCIRCGNCYRSCPEKLQVDKLFSHFFFHTEISEKVLESADRCFDCGVCDTACPARLPLAQTIALIKGGVR